MENLTMNDKKFEAEIAKIMAETVKINKESKYYVLSLVLGSTVLGAVIALSSALITAYFLK